MQNKLSIGIMSFEEVTDLMDLFEYDEFYSFDENTYRPISSTNEIVEGGVPLSVELSESLSKNQTSVSEESSSGFVKAPEIFLRIEGNSAGISSNIQSLCNNNRDENKSNKLKFREKSNSIESVDSTDVILPVKGDECNELQYENEFLSSIDEPDCDSLQKTHNRTNNIDNDYEELLFEGTNNILFKIILNLYT